MQERNRITFLLFLLCLALAGCGPRPVHEELSVETLERLALLPAASNSRHPGIRQELARLERDHEIPHLLGSRHTFVPLPQPVLGGRPTQMRATEWPLSMDVEQAAASVDLLNGIFADWPATFLSVNWKRALQILSTHEAERNRIGQALPVLQISPLTRHSHGLIADMHFVDVGQIFVRLELLDAMERLVELDHSAAFESFASAFSMIHLLSQEKHLVPRLMAASLRREVFRGLQAAIDKHYASRAFLDRMQPLVAAQLGDWPKDEGAWIGERAQGLHTYEMIRAGQLLSLLSVTEIKSFKQDGTLKEIYQAAVHVDSDQWYYLTTMRRIVSSCELPFYERVEVLRQIQEDQQRRAQEPDFPAIAVRLLLNDVIEIHQYLSLDRALCEAWELALSSAWKNDVGHQRRNPLTGERYAMLRNEQSVRVWGTGRDANDRPITVPRR